MLAALPGSQRRIRDVGAHAAEDAALGWGRRSRQAPFWQPTSESRVSGGEGPCTGRAYRTSQSPERQTVAAAPDLASWGPKKGPTGLPVGVAAS